MDGVFGPKTTFYFFARATFQKETSLTLVSPLADLFFLRKTNYRIVPDFWVQLPHLPEM